MLRKDGRRRTWIAALCLLGVVGCAARPKLWLFTAPWDARSEATLKAGVAPKATIVSGWISLDSAGALPVSLFEDPPRSREERRGARFALITSYRVDKFHPEAVRALARDVTARQRAADAIETLVRAGGYAGVVLDLEALEPGDTTSLGVVVGSLSAAARRGGAREVAIAVPALDTVAYAPRLLLPHVDRLLVMLYDQHWLGSEPGPVAARSWARGALEMWVKSAGADRMVAALPVYGYHWRSGAPTDVVGWSDVQRLARESGATVARDTASGSLRLQMGERGEAWLADGPLLAHMAEDARALGVRTLALWRLGLEDPAVWTALGVR